MQGKWEKCFPCIFEAVFLYMDFRLHKNPESFSILSNVEKSRNTSFFLYYCQNIRVCKKYTKNVELWKVAHILSSKLYT